MKGSLHSQICRPASSFVFIIESISVRLPLHAEWWKLLRDFRASSCSGVAVCGCWLHLFPRLGHVGMGWACWSGCHSIHLTRCDGHLLCSHQSTGDSALCPLPVQWPDSQACQLTVRGQPGAVMENTQAHLRALFQSPIACSSRAP